MMRPSSALPDSVSAVDQAGGLDADQLVLGLALELRVADEQRDQHAGASHDVLGGDLAGLLVAHQVAIGAQTLGEGVAQALLVGAALGRGHGVTVGVEEAVLVVVRPRHRPFHLPHVVGQRRRSGEEAARQQRTLLQHGGEEIAEAVGEVQRVLGGNVVAVVDEQRVALPANLHAAEQIGLGTGHAVQRARLQAGAVAEDFRVGMEQHGGAAPVLHRAHLGDRAQRRATAEFLAIQLALARHLDHQAVGQGIHHRDADAMQAARHLVGVAAELAARVQGGKDDFQRALVRELRVRINRDAAAVIPDGGATGGVQFQLDPAGVAGHRLVHGIVQHLGHQMVKRAVVGPADIHAGTAADGLQAFQDLDVLGGVFGALGGKLLEEIGHEGIIGAIPTHASGCCKRSARNPQHIVKPEVLLP